MEQLFLTKFTLHDLQVLIEHSIQKNIREGFCLTRKQAAKTLNISLPTLDLYSSNGTIKAHKLGSRILYKRTDIESALVPLT